MDGVVEGSVLHDGNRARLTAHLILTEPERHAWAQSYDSDISAVLTTQSQVARAIAGCIATVLRPAIPVTLPRSPARSVAPEITEAHLSARFEFERMSAEGIGSALRSFREINLKAPDFALRLTWHAACLFMLGYWGPAPAAGVYPSAKHLALHTRSTRRSCRSSATSPSR